ncbi:MAG: ATP synthase subunit C [Pseudomonadota bacterium]
MTWLISLMAASVLALIALGLWLELKPVRGPAPPWVKGGLLANFLMFALGLAGLLFLGAQDALAVEPAAVAAGEISLGKGLALIGIALPTAVAAIGAALALGPIGAAALAVTAEKPEIFGRTLVYMGLAEGVAIYGLVMSILMLGKI